MCGFLAEFCFENKEISFLEDFKQLLALSKSRGPDHSKIDNGNHYQLGFNRLSILDLSDRANQPIESASKTYHLVFNGEIYNYKALAKAYELPINSSTGDTEILIQLIDKLGIENSLAQLNGMYAIAIIDKNTGNLYLHRDRVGIKPLFYGINSHGVVCASQFNQIYKHPWFKKELQLRPEVMKAYFAFGYMQSPDTVFERIFQVNPGECKVISKDGSIRSLKLHEPLLNKNFCKEKGRNEYKNSKIDEAVQRQLVSHVPIASFLSGGIDSPLITAIAKKYKSDLTAFTLAVDDHEYDESEQAENYASQINVNHHKKYISEEDLLNIIEEHFNCFSEPFGDFSSIPTYLITKEASKTSKVMLSGDGGDELFFGYPRMLDLIKKRFWFIVPFKLRRIILRLMNKLSITNSWAAYHYSTFSEFVLEKHTHIFRDRLNTFFNDQWEFPKEIRELYHVKNNFNSRKVLNQLRFTEFYGHLQRILMKVDRFSMANSLEVRVPFLDYEVVMSANSYLPSSFESPHDLKSELKSQMLKYYSYNSINPKKKGFTVPIEQWLKGSLKKDLLLNIQAKKLFGSEYLNTVEVHNYINGYYTNKHNESWGIWHIYAWQKWALKEGFTT